MTFEIEKQINMSLPKPLTFINKTSSIKALCFLFLVSHTIFLLMMVFVFPRINPQIETQAFDLQTFGYSTTKAQSIVDRLDEPTKKLYLFPQLTLLDVLYPFLLALFLSSLLWRLGNLTGTKSKLIRIALYIPFLAMFCDYAENTCIMLMITRSVELSDGFVQLSSTFTVLKSVLTSIAWMGIFVYTISWLIVKIRANNNT